MIISFSVENFRSILERQVISFVASRFKGRELGVFECSEARNGILPVLAILGANGAGKSNILSALIFIQQAVLRSQVYWPAKEEISIERNIFSEHSQSKFEIVFIVKERSFRFGFECDRSGFSKEWLYEGRKVLYKRDLSRYRFGESFKGSRRAKEITRNNSLFLSASAQNNHPLLSVLYEWFHSWDSIGDQRDSERAFTSYLLTNDGTRDFLLRALSTLSPDIVAIESTGTDEKRSRKDHAGFFSNLKAWDDIQIHHKSSLSGKVAILPIQQESRGTQDYLAIAGTIMNVLYRGGLLILDEAASSLHPSVLRAIVMLFHSPTSNPQKAQLFLGTHDVTLLQPTVLRPDEVWFAERNAEGSVYYSLADFEGVRSETKAQRLYLEGRFGAVPFLDEHLQLFAGELAVIV